MQRILAGFLALILSGGGASLSAQPSALPPAIEKAIQERIEAGLYVGVAVGILDEEGAHFYNFGRRSIQGTEAVDENTVFEIGSISKVFTSLLLAEGVRAGDLALDQPIQELLPAGVTAPSRGGKSITLVSLATHTWGLPRLPSNLRPADPDNPYADYSADQLYSFLRSYTLPRDPGSRYEYSNYAAGLLGQLLARREGSTYPDLIREKISQPLGMNRTGIQLTPQMSQELAPGHRNGLTVKNWDIPTLAGAGAIRSTASDMLRFLAANLSLTDPGSLGPALALAHAPRREVGPKMEIGLGWHIREGNQKRKVVWHNGGTGGYRSFVGFEPKQKLGVVLLANSTESVDDLGFYILDRSFPLRSARASLAARLTQAIQQRGAAAIRSAYQDFKQEQPGFQPNEGELNSLGYQFLRADQSAAALEVFKLNVENFPKSSNAYDSLAEAYMVEGDVSQAILNYIESLKLDPSNENARQKLREMGMDPGQ